MKIAYILDDDISNETGVVRKIKSKITIWKKLNHKVRVFALRSKNNNSVIPEGTVVDNPAKDGATITVSKILRQFKMNNRIEFYLMKFQPDLIYMRNMKYYPGMVKVFKKYAPYVVEFNTIDVEQQKLYSKFGYFYNLLTRNVLLGNASGFVPVSHEIMKHTSNSKFNKPAVVIGNGYNFNNIEVIKKSFNKKIEFVFVGTPDESWHGVDKIIYLANEIKNHKFNIIGPKIEDFSNYKIGKNILFHGYLDQHKLERIVAKCDIGISTLALHRNNMGEASPLKSRQYLAQGLPIIIGYKDTDLPDNLDFVLNIGNYEENVKDNIEEIKLFIRKVKKTIPIQIVKESKTYLSYEDKEIKRLNFFKEIIKRDN